MRLRHSHEGGLALTASGEAIGMAVQGVRRVLVIPSATIGRVAGRLETHGRIARGYLGVGLQPVKLDDGIGAMVMSVDQSGPSAAAGIRQGDIIVGWNGEKLSGVRSLLRALGPDSVGSVVDVEIGAAANRCGSSSRSAKGRTRERGGCTGCCGRHRDFRSRDGGPACIAARRRCRYPSGDTGEAAEWRSCHVRRRPCRAGRHRAYAARTRRARADGRRCIEQGHRETAWNIRSHGQIPRRLAARQARRHRPHRCGGTRRATRRDQPVTPRARRRGSVADLGI